MILLPAILITAAIGWALIGRWVRCGWVPAVALGFATGVGLLSLQMFLYGLAHLPWHPLAVLLPWIPLGYSARRYLPARERIRWPGWLEWIALAAMLPAPLTWLPYERVMPLSTRNWDTWAIWLFKAKAFYMEGNLAGFLPRAGEFACQPSYPLLVPLYGAFLYELAGGPADYLAKAVSPCFFFALLGAFYYFVRRFASRPVALVFTAMLANLHMVNIVAFELAGYADTTLSVYLLLGAGFLCAWWNHQRHADLILASLFSSLAAWTKNEGLFFLAGAVLVVFVRLALRRPAGQGSAANWMLAAVWPVLAVVPWLVARRVYGVPGSDLFAGAVAWRNFIPGVENILRQAVKPNVYNLTFWLMAASPLLFRRAGLGNAFWLLPGFVLWQLGGLLGAYLSSRNEIQWWIGTSLDRILSQVAPLALLVPAIVAGAWIKEPAAPPDASAPKSQPSPGRQKRAKAQRSR